MLLLILYLFFYVSCSEKIIINEKDYSITINYEHDEDSSNVVLVLENLSDQNVYCFPDFVFQFSDSDLFIEWGGNYESTIDDLIKLKIIKPNEKFVIQKKKKRSWFFGDKSPKQYNLILNSGIITKKSLQKYEHFSRIKPIEKIDEIILSTVMTDGALKRKNLFLFKIEEYE